MKKPSRAIFRTLLLLCCVGYSLTGLVAQAANKEKALSEPTLETVAPLDDTATGRALFAAWEAAEHQFSPAVKKAFMIHARAQAVAELQAAGHRLPADFLHWVDSDPLLQAAVYGVKRKPANVLYLLRSLEIDLGVEVVRTEYTQLALAMAIANAETDPEELGASLKERPLLNLVIPASPLKPVDTNAPNRTLDAYDHVINFLNSEQVSEKVRQKPAKRGEPAIEKTIMRPMIGADVIKSQALQDKFNAYMQAHGQTVRVEVNGAWNEDAKGWAEAGKLFHDAYVAKGLLPTERDPAPTLAESTAFLIRNDRFRFPEGSKQEWPMFDLKSPWPTLALLAQNRMPLRELDDMWQNYVSLGRPLENRVKYLGNIAQRPPMLRANAVAPFDFYYGSAQMNTKDGGVCGAQSKTAAMWHLALGSPATTASSPTHCGFTAYVYDAKTKTYKFKGGNTPDPWIFGSQDKRATQSPYHFSVIAGVNHDLQAYLDSFVVHQLYALLPEKARQAHGSTLLNSGLELSPYNISLIEDLAASSSASALLKMRQPMQVRLEKIAEAKPGCPKDPEFLTYVLNRKISREPVPEDPAEVRAIHDYLEGQERRDVFQWMRYRVALEGMPQAQALFLESLGRYLADERTPKTSSALADELQKLSSQIKNRAERKAWGKKCLDQMAGKHAFLYRGKLVDDKVSEQAAKLAGVPLPEQKQRIQPLLDELANDWRATIESGADRKVCHPKFWVLLRVVNQIEDAEQKKAWCAQLQAPLGDNRLQAHYKKVLADKSGSPQAADEK